MSEETVSSISSNVQFVVFVTSHNSIEFAMIVWAFQNFCRSLSLSLLVYVPSCECVFVGSCVLHLCRAVSWEIGRCFLYRHLYEMCWIVRFIFWSLHECVCFVGVLYCVSIFIWQTSTHGFDGCPFASPTHIRPPIICYTLRGGRTGSGDVVWIQGVCQCSFIVDRLSNCC